jgi:hypothetical protein
LIGKVCGISCKIQASTGPPGTRPKRRKPKITKIEIPKMALPKRKRKRRSPRRRRRKNPRKTKKKENMGTIIMGLARVVVLVVVLISPIANRMGGAERGNMTEIVNEMLTTSRGWRKL